MTVQTAHEHAVSILGTVCIVVLPVPPLSRLPPHSSTPRPFPLLLPPDDLWMNPKHFHTPVSTRLRCPVCHQPVYSRGGIHPQCAMRQSEPAMPKIDKANVTIAAEPRASSP